VFAGTSYLNRTEAANVEKLLTRFLQAGVLPAQLGVITPYEGQRANIVATLLRHGPLRQDLYMAVEVEAALLKCSPEHEHGVHQRHTKQLSSFFCHVLTLCSIGVAHAI
jgi:hypothetical protein